MLKNVKEIVWGEMVPFWYEIGLNLNHKILKYKDDIL